MIADEYAYPTGFKDFEGMTMLDYFAAKAMQALITETGISVGNWADDAYEMAWKMMQSRKKYHEKRYT